MPSEFPGTVRRLSILFLKTFNLYHQRAKISFKKNRRGCWWGVLFDVKTFWHSIPRQICSSAYIKQQSLWLCSSSSRSWYAKVNLKPHYNLHSSDKLEERHVDSGAICSGHCHWKGLRLTPKAPHSLWQSSADLLRFLSCPKAEEEGGQTCCLPQRAPSGRGPCSNPQAG